MRRWLLGLAAFACGGVALIGFASSGADQVRAPAAAAAAPSNTSGSALVRQGHALFLSSCASCHGLGARGIPGRGPSLHGVGALAADFYLRTGRMPLPNSRAEPLRGRPAFRSAQIDALTAYVASFGGPSIPVVTPARGSLPRGQSLFALNCAGCHTIQGQGGIVTGATVPSLDQASPREIAQAIRIGPYVMPRFGPGELSAADIDSIARYVQSTQHPQNPGGWDIGRIGPIPEGMVAWLLAIAALLLIARLLGERTEDERRSARGEGSGEDR